jgi:hypothetical protein
MGSVGVSAVMVVVNVAFSDAKPVELLAPSVGVSVTVPLIGVAPFRNCTVPLGATPLLCVEIVAVKVTIVPDVILLGTEATPVVVVAFVTVTESVMGPLGMKLLSPE